MLRATPFLILTPQPTAGHNADTSARPTPVVQWKLFADLAEVAGTDQPTVETDAETVGEALSALLAAHPGLAERVTDDDGDLRDHVNLLREGEPADPDTPVDPDDELALFPPVSGG